MSTRYIIGASGYVGTAFARALKTEAAGNTLKLVRSTNCVEASANMLRGYSEYQASISAFAPDELFICMGSADVDYCEKNPRHAKEINLEIPLKYVTAGLTSNPHLSIVVVSTCYVYGQDSPEQGFTEKIEPQPISVYGKYKLQLEREVRLLCARSVVIRTPFLVGNPSHQKDFIGSVYRTLSNNEKVIIDDSIRFPTHVGDLASVAMHLMSNGEYGIYHFSCNEQTSRYDMAIYIASKLGPTAINKVSHLTTFDQGNLRPRFLKLATDHKMLAAYNTRSWRKVIDVFLAQMGHKLN